VPVVPHTTYTLDAGDRVRIIVFGQQNLSNVYTVSATDTVSVPLIGPIRGLTVAEVARRLRDQYIKDPKVTAEVVTYTPFSTFLETSQPRDSILSPTGSPSKTLSPLPKAIPREPKNGSSASPAASTASSPPSWSQPDYPVQPGDTIYVLPRLF
jgi:polysaccharide export outer membrane protein